MEWWQERIGSWTPNWSQRQLCQSFWCPQVFDTWPHVPCQPLSWSDSNMHSLRSSAKKEGAALQVPTLCLQSLAAWVCILTQLWPETEDLTSPSLGFLLGLSRESSNKANPYLGARSGARTWLTPPCSSHSYDSAAVLPCLSDLALFSQVTSLCSSHISALGFFSASHSQNMAGILCGRENSAYVSVL